MVMKMRGCVICLLVLFIRVDHTNTKDDKYAISAPLWQQSIDWLFKALDFYYPMINLKVYSDGSGLWSQSKDELNEHVSIGFDDKEECILNAIELLKTK
jgi:hypothetical protein